MFLTLFQWLNNLVSHFISVLRLINNIFIILTLKEFCQSNNWIVFFLPLLSLILWSIKCWVIWCWMIAHSICHKLNKIWFFLFKNVLSCTSGNFKTCQSIITIDSCWSDTHWNCTWDDTVRGVLVAGWCGDGVLIVSA